MFMQKIRHSTRKHRHVVLIVVIVLNIGLVVAFGVWDSGDKYSRSSGGTTTAADTVASYEEYLAGQEPADPSGIDYTQAVSLAQSYATLGNYCLEAALAAEDSTQSAEYMVKRGVAATKAADYYGRAIELAPDTITGVSLAVMQKSQAEQLLTAGETEAARPLYEAAYAAAPDNYDIARSYAIFKMSTEGYDAAAAVLDAYMATQERDSTNYQNAEAFKQYLQFNSNIEQ